MARKRPNERTCVSATNIVMQTRRSKLSKLAQWRMNKGERSGDLVGERSGDLGGPGGGRVVGTVVSTRSS